MELTNEFRVPVPVDTAWSVLTDIEGIAPCLPGAELQEVEGDEYRGIVKVKVGPIKAQYKGAATFVERDRDAARMVLHAEGNDTRGQGRASADITAQLSEAGDSTNVLVTTDLKITGKVAQFGRGVLAEVSAKLLEQFVECLEQKLQEEQTEPMAKPEPEPEPTTTPPERSEPVGTEHKVAEAPAGAAASVGADGEAQPGEARDEPSGQSSTASVAGERNITSGRGNTEPVDLLGSAGVPVLKRVAPVVTALVLIFFLGRRWRRRSSGES